MAIITKRDLSIFRGTYKECMAQATEDMRIYLAWDTQEIFIGNKLGTKVKYGFNPGMITILMNESESRLLDSCRELIDSEISSQLEGIRSDITDMNLNVESALGEIHDVSEDMSTRMDEIERSYNKVQGYINGFRTELNSQKEAFDESVRKLQTKDNELNQAILNNKSLIETLSGAFDDFKEKEYNIKIAALEKADADLQKKIEDLTTVTNQANTALEEKISALREEFENRVAAVETSINENINTKINSLESADDVIRERITNIENNGAPSTNSIRILSGAVIEEEVGERTTKNTLDQFRPAFCIKNGSPAESNPSYIAFKKGCFYFYDEDTKKIAGAKTTYDSLAVPEPVKPNYYSIRIFRDGNELTNLRKSASLNTTYSFKAEDLRENDYIYVYSTTSGRVIYMGIFPADFEQMPQVPIDDHAGDDRKYYVWRFQLGELETGTTVDIKIT